MVINVLQYIIYSDQCTPISDEVVPVSSQGNVVYVYIHIIDDYLIDFSLVEFHSNCTYHKFDGPRCMLLHCCFICTVALIEQLSESSGGYNGLLDIIANKMSMLALSYYLGYYIYWRCTN